MRIRNPKIKRALMTGMACLSTVIAVLSFTLKLPQAFLDGQNSLSVLAAGLTPPFLFRKAREPFSGVFLAAAHREIGKDESLFF